MFDLASSTLVEIETASGSGYAALVSGAAVSSVTVSIPSSLQTYNQVEGSIDFVLNTAVLNYFEIQPNGATANTFGGLVGAGFGSATPFALARNGNGFVLGATSTDGTFTNCWADFKMVRAGGIWRCSALFGAADAATALHRTIQAEAKWSSAANLTSLVFSGSVASSILAGSVIRLRGRP